MTTLIGFTTALALVPAVDDAEKRVFWRDIRDDNIQVRLISAGYDDRRAPTLYAKFVTERENPPRTITVVFPKSGTTHETTVAAVVRSAVQDWGNDRRGDAERDVGRIRWQDARMEVRFSIPPGGQRGQRDHDYFDRWVLLTVRPMESDRP